MNRRKGLSNERCFHNKILNFSAEDEKKRRRRNGFVSLNTSFFDKDAVESAAKTILKIVHPGKEKSDRNKREENKDKIKNHILRVMKPSVITANRSFRSEFVPKTSDMSTKQRIQKYEDNSIHENISRKEDYERRRSSNRRIERISNDYDKKNESSLFSSNALKRRVSFAFSPEKEVEKFDLFSDVSNDRRTIEERYEQIDESFRTPPPSVKVPLRFSEPPPLINTKRRFDETDRAFKLLHDNKRITTNHIKLKEHRIIHETEEKDTDKNSISFDFETILKTPERIEEPYDILGLSSHYKTTRF